MRKIKDFFYDKNDIIIVLIILAVAALIIYVRIGNIMEYPEKLAKQAAATQETETVSTTESHIISVTIEESDSVADVSKKLNDAGLTSSATAFEKYVDEQNEQRSDGDITIKDGTFQIPDDATLEEILDIIEQIVDETEDETETTAAQ